MYNVPLYIWAFNRDVHSVCHVRLNSCGFKGTPWWYWEYLTCTNKRFPSKSGVIDWSCSWPPPALVCATGHHLGPWSSLHRILVPDHLALNLRAAHTREIQITYHAISCSVYPRVHLQLYYNLLSLYSGVINVQQLASTSGKEVNFY